MYLQPWQIFAGGCVCGAFIMLLILTFIIIRVATHSGVRVERVEKQEEDENG